jgi:hypothetical protein
MRSKDVNVAANAMNEFVSSTIPKIRLPKVEGTFGQLLAGICAKHNVRVEDVLGRGKTQTIVEARKEFICILYFHHNFTAGDIGRLLDMDLTSVKHLLGLRKGSKTPHEVLRKMYA